uniref:Uncharacterized protein n=1 Tax=Solanum tuberosum TaxID=4113 RepID=M1A756_SOLTU
MFGIGRNGAKKHLSSMVNGIRFHLFCSKADELVVHFMVNSLGFSTKEAISTSAKAERWMKACVYLGRVSSLSSDVCEH